MIHGPFSEEFFWYDDSESDPEFLDPWNDHLSPQSNNDWGWDEWGDLVVFRPVGHEPNYKYPLVIWLTVRDEVPGVTLRDWFPDLSDRNYIAAEVQLSATGSPAQHANRVSLAIREIAALYTVHRHRIWIAGSELAADEVLKLLPILAYPVTGGIAIAPVHFPESSHAADHDRSLYLATEYSAGSTVAEEFADDWSLCGGPSRHTTWESMEAARLAICRDLNLWLMEQVCAPAGNESRG